MARIPTATVIALHGLIHLMGADGRDVAAARMRYAAKEITGTFRFTVDGDVTAFDAIRYDDHKEGATLEQWRVEISPDGYRDFEGVRVPARSAVS